MATIEQDPSDPLDPTGADRNQMTTASTSLPVGLVKAMRPHQWVKNALVFAAPLAAGALDERDVFIKTVGAFVTFCLAAGGTYLLNDARDVESDRRHPVKCRRPIAAGIVPVGVAVATGVIALAASLALSLLINRPSLTLTIVAYLALTTAYTLYLKHQPVLDIVSVAAGFVLRVVAGAAATSVPISEWFFIVTSAGALLMVVGKRQGEAAELQEGAGDIRPVLKAYTPSFLVFLRSVAAAMVLIAYCAWAFESTQHFPQRALAFQLSILPFVVAILRYALLIDQGKGAEPERLVLRDRVMQVSGLVWAIIYAYGVYVA